MKVWLVQKNMNTEDLLFLIVSKVPKNEQPFLTLVTSNLRHFRSLLILFHVLLRLIHDFLHIVEHGGCMVGNPVFYRPFDAASLDDFSIF